MYNKRLKAGALQLTLGIIVVIALLLASFLLLFHTNKQFSNQSKLIKETIENANKGIEYTLIHDINTLDTTTVHLNDDDYKSLKIHKDYWGIFEKVTAVSNIKNNRFIKHALVGASQPKQDRLALYVEDNNKPLVLVGDTNIEGVAYLPRQGVKTGNIAGHSYYGSQLIYGTTRTSNRLPKILLEPINSFNSTTFGIEEEQFIDISKVRIHKNSFLNPEKIIYSNTDIFLSQIRLTGHIKVVSKTRIIVDPSADLKDVVLVAPEIEIKSYTKGTFQAIVTKKVIIGEYCNLNYPSALILKEKKQFNANAQQINQEDHQIIIGNNSYIKGVVGLIGEKTPNNYRVQMIIEEKATVEGDVYCNMNIELKGTVFGNVFASNFVANQAGSIYQNHIYNGTINISQLPIQYVGLLFEDSEKSVAKWLY